MLPSYVLVIPVIPIKHKSRNYGSGHTYGYFFKNEALFRGAEDPPAFASLLALALDSISCPANSIDRLTGVWEGYKDIVHPQLLHALFISSATVPRCAQQCSALLHFAWLRFYFVLWLEGTHRVPKLQNGFVCPLGM